MGNSLVINCWKTFHTSDAPSISEMSVELRFPIASITMFDDLRVTSIFWWRKMLTDASWQTMPWLFVPTQSELPWDFGHQPNREWLHLGRSVICCRWKTNNKIVIPFPWYKIHQNTARIVPDMWYIPLPNHDFREFHVRDSPVALNITLARRLCSRCVCAISPWRPSLVKIPTRSLTKIWSEPRGKCPRSWICPKMRIFFFNLRGWALKGDFNTDNDELN